MTTATADRIEVRKTDGSFLGTGYGVFLDGNCLMTCFGPRARERAEGEAQIRRDRLSLSEAEARAHG